MGRTKKTISKKRNTKKGVSGRFNTRYFSKLDKKSIVVKNMINNIDNTNDFKAFILDLPAKYYIDLSLRMKKEVFELIIEYLETNTIKYKRRPKIHTFVLIGFYFLGPQNL